ncbi:tyrosine-type recombinase/integrase [bacterium AH-315-G05]|nr:tyrosine-type recombinase/integrase [Alkaliphilus sp. AH-315-G20]MBN4069747.1 tyrosine-type recombinase/integrase [bacterium AH-315-G05]
MYYSAECEINKNLHLAVPKSFSKQVKIVTTLSEKARSHLISNSLKPDRLNKRNHAMILLALNLGLRRSDVVNLKLKDIDWKNDSITFVQKKTKVPVTLPLSIDVGNALMDYILNSRPEIDEDVIFLRGYAPYRALSPSSTRIIIKKYLGDFGIDDCPEKGFHILRRSAATKMLECNVNSEVVSAALGHLDVKSVDVYLSTNSLKMRKCALTLNGIECSKEELL